MDASVMYRRWKESNGKDEEYKTIIVRQVKKSQEEAKKDNVTSKSFLVYKIFIFLERVLTEYTVYSR